MTRTRSLRLGAAMSYSARRMRESRAGAELSALARHSAFPSPILDQANSSPSRPAPAVLGFVEGRQLRLPPFEDRGASFAFDAQGSGSIEDAPPQAFGQVLLGYPMVAIGMRVEIAFAVAEALGVSVRVLQVGGHFGGLRLDGGERVEVSEGGV